MRGRRTAREGAKSPPRADFCGFGGSANHRVDPENKPRPVARMMSAGDPGRYLFQDRPEKQSNLQQ
jgi:hypothetical protein